MKRTACLLLCCLLALQLAACGKPVMEESSTVGMFEPGSSNELDADPNQGQVTAGQGISTQVAQLSAGTGTKKAANPFSIPTDYNVCLYTLDPANLTYTRLGIVFLLEQDDAAQAGLAVLNAINSLPTLSPVAASDSAVTGGFMTVDPTTYAKVQYLLRPGILEVNGTSYGLTEKQYNHLLRLSGSSADDGFLRIPQWLVYMNPNRVKKIAVTHENGKTENVVAHNITHAAARSDSIEVYSGKAYDPATAAPLKNSFQLVMTFDNGVQYRVALKGDKVRVESSDMSYGCEYKGNQKSIELFIETTKNFINGPLNPETGKPVIYLYPERTQDVEVKLDFKGTLFYTFPTYRDGWRVTAKPDGTLTDKTDGSTHYYLFWDGTPDRDTWDFSQGFLVKGSETESFLREKLPLLGLTPKEYNDFIVYWVPEMMQNPYNLITFSTTEYEETAPLSITPAPDTLIRVHMVYTPMYEEVAIKEQILPTPPPRNGFTVVEWGGTRA